MSISTLFSKGNHGHLYDGKLHVVATCFAVIIALGGSRNIRVAVILTYTWYIMECNDSIYHVYVINVIDTLTLIDHYATRLGTLCLGVDSE